MSISDSECQCGMVHGIAFFSSYQLSTV
jgi:hypothetical protein